MSRIRIVSERGDSAHECDLTVSPLAIWQARCYLAVAGCSQVQTLFSAGCRPSEAQNTLRGVSVFCETSLASDSTKLTFYIQFFHILMSDVYKMILNNINIV